MKSRVLRLLTAAIAGLLVAAGDAAAATRPNVVLIMTDNHGAWSLGCYGNRDVRTPHIDRLARRGLLFEHCYSSNPVCSPTRATWLTGLMPSQHGVHCYIANHVQLGPRAHATLREFRSLGDVLSAAGYTCGLSGKWHLGRNMDPQEGFSFWVTKPGGSTSSFYDQQVIENGRTRRQPGYITEYWTRRGMEFIEQNRERPFFLFLAYNGPYGLSNLLLRPPRNRHAPFYAGRELASFPRRPRHPWLYNNRDYLNNPVSMRRYAAEISAIDDGVGKIMATLARLGLDKHTLVVFTADQGLAGGHGGIWGMGDHTRPLSAFDSTMHVPLIFHWPGHVPAGKRSSLLVSNYDFFPTLLNYLGLQDRIPRDPPRPGRDISPLLRGAEVSRPDDEAVYYEFETVRAIRTSRWKLVIRLGGGLRELYDLENDPEEQENLIDRPATATVQKKLRHRLTAFFQRYADPRYDLARGGTSQAGFLISERHPVARPSSVSGEFTLDAANAQLAGPAVRFAEDHGSIQNLQGPDDQVRWLLRGVRAGRYRIELLLQRGAQRPDREPLADRLKLTIDAESVVLEPRGQARPVERGGQVRHSFTVAVVPLKPGNHELVLSAAAGGLQAGTELVAVRLVPDEQATGS